MARPRAGDGDVRRIELDASGEQLAAADQLPYVRPDAAARRARQDSLVVLRPQFEPFEIQLRSIPAKCRRYVRERDVIADSVMDPILDLGLVVRHAVERQLDGQQQHDHETQCSCAAIEQDLAEFAQRHLHQNDVVLVDGIKSFGLQANGLAGCQFQFPKRGRLLIEQALDHVLVGQHHQLLTLELA